MDEKTDKPDGICAHCGCPYYAGISLKVGTQDYKRFCAPSCEQGTARKIFLSDEAREKFLIANT